MVSVELTEQAKKKIAFAVAEELKKGAIKNCRTFGLVSDSKEGKHMIDSYEVIEGKGAHAHLVNTTPQSVFHEIGTGINFNPASGEKSDEYSGNKGKKIKPKNGPFLWWKVRGKDVGKYRQYDPKTKRYTGRILKVGEWVSAKEIRGVPASGMIRKKIMELKYK